MSKITPKNLHYDTTLPPFLARLQSQNTNQDGRQDFHAARPKKPRDEDAEREDEPVVFDEVSGETLTRGEWEEREKFEGGSGGDVGVVKGDGGGDEVKEEGGKEGEKKEEKVAGIGVSRKRKAGKVVGGGGGDDDEESENVETKALKDAVKQATASVGKSREEGKSKGDGKTTEKGGKGGAKKGKKIKLSFGDDD